MVNRTPQQLLQKQDSILWNTSHAQVNVFDCVVGLQIPSALMGKHALTLQTTALGLPVLACACSPNALDLDAALALIAASAGTTKTHSAPISRVQHRARGYLALPLRLRLRLCVESTQHATPAMCATMVRVSHDVAVLQG
jgi:hypothetical protein